MSSFRYLMPLARRTAAVAGKPWQGALQHVRGKKDLPVWPGWPGRSLRRQGDWPWDDPVFRNFLRHWPTAMEQQMRNAMENMSRFFPRALDWPPPHGENAEVVDVCSFYSRIF
jgi:hypothetical protein